MKIIHTSDWHLGRTFGPHSLRADQEAFCDYFVDLVADESADLVVIAGDLYDRAVAPTEAIGLFRDTIGRLLASGTVVAAITGNHDGADRVAPFGAWLDLSRFYLRGGYGRIGEVITHEFADGPLDLVLLPYLDPRAAPDDFAAAPDDFAAWPDGEAAATVDEADSTLRGDDIPADEPGSDAADAVARERVARRQARTHQSVLQAASARALAARRSRRSLAVAHAFVTGGTVSDSERALTVGGTGAVDASVFDGFSTVMLGHLHRPQTIGTDGRIAYSGTPLAYSFSENHSKSLRIVELTPDGDATTRIEAVPVGHRAATITGTIDELLDPSRHADAHDSFVRARITNRETVLDAKARLSTLYPLITEVSLEPDGVEPGSTADVISTTTRRLAPIDAVHEFWQVVEGADPDDETTGLLIEATARATAVAS